MDTIDRHVLVVMSKKKGNLKYSVYGYSPAMLSMFAMRKLKGSESAMVANLRNGSIVYVIEGNKDRFPIRKKGDPDVVVADITLQMLIRDDPVLEEETFEEDYE